MKYRYALIFGKLMFIYSFNRFLQVELLLLTYFILYKYIVYANNNYNTLYFVILFCSVLKFSWSSDNIIRIVNLPFDS